MPSVLVKLSEKSVVGLQLSQQRLQTVRQSVHTFLILEKVLYIPFYLTTQVLVSLQHSQQLVERQVQGLEHLAGKDREDSIVDECVREDLPRVRTQGHFVLRVIHVLEVVLVA